MKDKVWEVLFEGRTLRVTNRISLLPPRTSEHLQVDGETVKENNGGFLRMNATLRAKVDFHGAPKELEVQIAQKTGSLQTGCHILVDGQIIGGDVQSKLQYPDPDIAAAQYAEGPVSFFVKTGLLRYGLPFAVSMSLIGKPSGTLAVTVMTFVAQLVFFGGTMGWFMWKSLKTQVGRADS